MKLYFLSFLLLLGFASQATTYYVDASTTSSTQNGSAANPWKTLSQVNSNMSSFRAGDFILFKRGGVYTGTLNVNCSGASGSPITFGAYGTGEKPKLTGTGSTIGYLIYVNINKSYLTFRDLWITDPSIDNQDRSIDAKIQRAFTFDEGATNNKIISCDIHLVGVAGYFIGGSNTMDSCDVGNLRMVVDTDQGYQPGNDDDYGANPLVISSANNTITHNYFHDCWATSYDYDFDGGAIEFYGSGTDNNFIAYNTIYDCIGLSEITGNSSNNTYAYNKLINNGSLFYFQSGYTYTGFKFYNNVVVENVAPRVPESRMIGGSMGSNAVAVKNNIFHLSTGTDVAGSATGLTHEDNIYKLSNNSVVGFTLSSSELSTSAAIFTNTTAASALSWNYTPVSGSPAIDFGQNVGLTKDFAGNAVPSIPNSGILESGGGTTPPVDPIVASSTATTINCNGGTATVTVSATGGTAPYTGTGSFNVSAGTYNYTVTDAAGGSATTSIVIVEPAALDATIIAGTAPSASGTAAATITAIGGTPVYTYSLDGGAYQSDNVFPAVTVGTHSITVRDGRACTVTKNFTISAASSTPLVISAVTGTIACNGSTTNVTISATGGKEPYTGTGTFSIGAGTYTYTVTDANGTTGSYTVIVTEPEALVLSASATAITFAGGVSTVTASASGGTAPYTYQVGSGAFQSANTFDDIPAGTYTVTVKDANGCTASESLTITQPGETAPFKLALVTRTNLSCRDINDGTIVVAGSGGTAPYQYRINFGAYQTSGTFENLRPGFYVVSGKDVAGTTSSVFVIISNSSVSCDNSAAKGGTTTTASAKGTVVDQKQVNTPNIEGLKINAYPNPTTTEWSVMINNNNIDEDIHVVVMNMNGQAVYQGKTRANQKISFGNNLASGMYIAKITQGNTTQTIKLVKAK